MDVSDPDIEIAHSLPKIQSALQESESLRTALWESSLDGIVLLNALGLIEDLNASAQRMFGFQAAEWLHRPLQTLVSPAESRQGYAKLVGKRVERIGLRSDGSQFPLELVLARAGDKFVATLRDLSGLQQAQAQLERKNRLHLVLSKVSEAIVRTTDQMQLYQAACRIAFEEGKFSLAAIVAADPRTGQVHPLVQHGDDAGCLSQIRVNINDPKLSSGTIGSSLRTGRYDLSNQLAGEVRMAPWAERLQSHSYASTASFPIQSEGKVVSALVLFSDEADYFEADRVELLVAVAKNLSFAIEALERQERREQAEMALRAREFQMAAAQRIAHFGSWELDLKNESDFTSNPLRCSDEVLRLFQAPSDLENITYGDFLRAVHLQDRPRLQEAQQSLLAGASRIELEHRIVRPGGVVRWLHNIIEVHHDPQARPQKLMGTVLDITDRKRAENERDAFFSLSLDLLCVANFEGRFEQVNQAWTDCLGWSAHELTSRRMLDFIHPEDHEATQKIRQELYQGKPLREFQNRYLCKDGSYRWLSWNVHPLPESRQVFSVARDITQSRRDAQTLAGIVDIQQEMAKFSTLDLEVMQLVATRSMELMGAHGSVVEQVDGDEVVYRACAGSLAGLVGMRLKRSSSLSGHVLALGEALWSEDTECDARVDLSACRKVEARAMIIVPIKKGEEGFGVIKVMWREPRTISQPDIHNLQLLAETLGAVIHRHQADQALRSSVEEFRTLAEAMPQMVWSMEPDGNVTYVNQQWLTYTGMTLEELQGAGWIVAFHREDRARSKRAWQRAQVERHTYTLECRLRAFDGSYRWWLARAQPQLDSEGQVIRWFGTCTDIHDRKLTELEVQRMNRALKMLSGCSEIRVRAQTEQALLQGICQIAVDIGGYRMAWVGYALHNKHKSVVPQAFAGHHDHYLSQVEITWDSTRPSGQGPVGQVLRGASVAGIPDLEAEPLFAPLLTQARSRGYRGMVCLPLKDGQRVFGVLVLYLAEVRQQTPEELQLLGELVENLSYGIVALRAQVERQEMQEAVLSIAQQVREQAELLDMAQDAITVRDLEDRVSYWNRSAERLFGWSRHEALGRNFNDLLQDMDPTQAAEALRTVLERGEWSGEVQKKTRGGALLTIDSRWTLVRDADGRSASIMSIDTDVTLRKKLEQQFLRAQRIDSIGTLAGGIAHDLNNALSPIIMSNDLLKMMHADADTLELLDVIGTSARRGADMVRQVLSFARGVEGRRVEVDIEALIKDIEKIVNETFLKHITVRILHSSGPCKAIGDSTQIQQVLLNLCVNARDAMAAGGTLEIAASQIQLGDEARSLHPDARPGPYILIVVTDTGCGMPDELIDKIFDPFFTTKEVGKGTGLGLSTSQAIVKSHGGFLRVFSQPQKGSIFEVYLPACLQSLPQVETFEVSTDLPRGEGRLVLIVDDEDIVRRVTRQTLETFGYRVLEAVDGADALQVCARHKEELSAILTDMTMPNMDGPAFVRAFRQTDGRLPILAASGLAAEASHTAFPSAGVDHYLPKPYTAENLLNALDQILSARRES